MVLPVCWIRVRLMPYRDTPSGTRISTGVVLTFSHAPTLLSDWVRRYRSKRTLTSVQMSISQSTLSATLSVVAGSRSQLTSTMTSSPPYVRSDSLGLLRLTMANTVVKVSRAVVPMTFWASEVSAMVLAWISK